MVKKNLLQNKGKKTTMDKWCAVQVESTGGGENKISLCKRKDLFSYDFSEMTKQKRCDYDNVINGQRPTLRFNVKFVKFRPFKIM